MLDRIASLEVFAKVAATGSFSGAARALGLSQTMVSKHIAALEERLGVRLFHRTTRKVSITDSGQTYLEASALALADLAAAEEAVAAERFEPRGLLRVAAPMSLGSSRLAPLIPEFSRLYPRLSVELGLNDRRVDLAEEGWDLAVRIGILQDSSLIARRLAPCRTILCAAPAYLAEHGTPHTVAELAQHNCLSYTLSRVTGAGHWIFGANHEVKVNVSGNLRANNGDALRWAAVGGQGLIYEPTSRDVSRRPKCGRSSISSYPNFLRNPRGTATCTGNFPRARAPARFRSGTPDGDKGRLLSLSNPKSANRFSANPSHSGKDYSAPNQVIRP